MRNNSRIGEANESMYGARDRFEWKSYFED